MWASAEIQPTDAATTVTCEEESQSGRLHKMFIARVAGKEETAR